MHPSAKMLGDLDAVITKRITYVALIRIEEKEQQSPIFNQGIIPQNQVLSPKSKFNPITA